MQDPWMFPGTSANHATAIQKPTTTKRVKLGPLRDVLRVCVQVVREREHHREESLESGEAPVRQILIATYPVGEPRDVTSATVIGIDPGIKTDVIVISPVTETENDATDLGIGATDLGIGIDMIGRETGFVRGPGPATENERGTGTEFGSVTETRNDAEVELAVIAAVERSGGRRVRIVEIGIVGETRQ